MDEPTLEQQAGAVKWAEQQLDGYEFELSAAQATIRRHAELVRLYEELLYGVATKHPNESRHETALRYIRRAESHDADKCGQAALVAAIGKEP